MRNATGLSAHIDKPDIGAMERSMVLESLIGQTGTFMRENGEMEMSRREHSRTKKAINTKASFREKLERGAGMDSVCWYSKTAERLRVDG